MNSTAENNPIDDEIALNNLSSKYTDAVNRYDADSWISCWTEDAEWELMGTRVTGKEQILGLWHQMMSGFEFALMLPSSGMFNIDAARATGHWYLQEYTRDKEGNASTVVSRYQDTYRKIGNQWFFQSREYHLICSSDIGLNGPYNPCT